MYFALEARHRVRLYQDFWSDRLDRDVLAQFLIFGLVYIPHAATRDETDDAESPSQYLTLRQSRAPSPGLTRDVDQCRRGEKRCGLVVFGKEPLDLGAQACVWAALLQEGGAVCRILLQGSFKQRFHYLPVFLFCR